MRNVPFMKRVSILCAVVQVRQASCLVCEAWHGRPPTEKHQVAHWDGNKANNHFGNLRWATPQENSHDCVRQGIDPVGVRKGRAKLSEADVREIRATYKGGYRNLKSFARNMAFQAQV